MLLSRHILRKAKPENLIRLAKWLKLHIDGISHRQIVNLVYWRITRQSKRDKGMLLNG